MTASTLISDYIGTGTHSARPASPNVPAGGSAIYFETDTEGAFMWDGTAWVQTNNLIVPAIVQDKSAQGASVTMDAAPTEGNILLGFQSAFDNSSGNVNTTDGWTLVAYQQGGRFYGYVCMKIAGASESTTQEPMNDGGYGGMCSVVEVTANGIAWMGCYNDSSFPSVLNFKTPGPNGLIIAQVNNQNGNAALPSAIDGDGVLNSSATGNPTGANCSCQVISCPVEAGDTTTLDLTYASGPANGIQYVYLR